MSWQNVQLTSKWWQKNNTHPLCQSLFNIPCLPWYTLTSCSSVCLWLCQVLVASARAHLLIKKYSVDVVSARPAALRRLLAWKETRAHQELSTDSTDSIATAWYWILLFFKRDSMVEGKYRKKPSAQLFSLALTIILQHINIKSTEILK